MKVQYVVTDDDFRAYARRVSLHYILPFTTGTPFNTAQRLGSTLYLVACVLLVVSGGHLLYRQQLIGWVPLVVGVLLGAQWVWQRRPSIIQRQMVRHWRERPGASDPISMYLDEAGFHYTEATSQIDLGWAAIAGVEELDSVIVVNDVHRRSYLVQTRAFANVEQQRAFVQFMRDRIAMPAR